MKKLLAILGCVLVLANLSFAANPTFNTGTTHHCASVAGTTGCAITFSPTNGHKLGLCVGFSNNNPSSITAADNNSVSLTAGPVSSTANGESAFFYYTISGSPTSFTVKWSGGNSASTGAAGDYINVVAVLGNPTGGTASGSASPSSISPTAQESGDLAIGCSSVNAANQQTASVGTVDEEAHSASPGIALEHASATGATATNMQTTFTTTSWEASGIIFTNAAVGGTPNQFPQIY